MKCSSCNKENRDKAKYCKHCGTPIVAKQMGATGIASLVGKDNLVQQITAMLDGARAIAAQGKQRGVSQRARLSFVITGVTGVGKNTVAEAIAAELFAAGIVKTPNPTVVKSVDYAEFIKDIKASAKKVGNNVLIIDEAHKHCPKDRADSICDLDKILQNINDWCDDPDQPVVVILGDENLRSFFENNPAEAAKIQYSWQVPPPDIAALTDIVCFKLQNQYSCTVDDDARAKIGRVLTAAKRDNPDTFPYGHFAAKIAYDAYVITAADPIKPNEVTADEVRGKEFVPKTFDQVMAEFDQFVGIDEIKNEIRKIAVTVENARQAGLDPYGSVKSHYIFVGNPGTGKTTMARLFADALSAMGALPSGHLVEVDREKLVSQYVGESSKLVRKAVNDAMGGVLFIDEAYSLCSGNDDSFGKQVVDTLLKDCEDLKGKFVCIMAGYPVEMKQFLGTNSGLQRRFDTTINFRDYTGPELTQIFRNMAKGVKPAITFADDVEQQIGQYFDKVYLTRSKRFGNAGEVKNRLEAAVKRMRVRVDAARQDGSLQPGTENVLTMADIEAGSKKSIDEILATFDDMIGMGPVKDQIQAIAKSVQMQQRMIERGIGNASVTNVHIILTGNPGTGKTTVANRLGQVFNAIGILPTDQVIVKKAEDIFDSYAKSAGKNMTKAVDDAMGGILFIDEAYNLLPVSTPGTQDASGVEAVNALMTCMSERAGQFICVIAGYKTEIDEFIRNANDGLERRFTHRIHIPDYNEEDLTQIFLQQVKKGNFKITDEAVALLRRKIGEMVTAKDEKFGNAGTIIKLFDQTKERHFANIDIDADDDALITITDKDIPYDAPKKLNIDEIMAQLDHLTGLDGVKKAVRDLADTLVALQARAEDMGQKGSINLDHYLFLGNPGTGKTTVARLMGNIFYSLGLLPSNKVIEISAKDMVAPYVGQTAPKTHAAMMRGMGGVVFVDEAYSLTGSGESNFGAEAVAEMLQVMENYKNKFICIAAGYHREMQQWLNTNSGLSSRFPTTINFDDYTAEELSEIATNIFARVHNLRLTDAAKDAMLRHFTSLVSHKTRNFANAREARNYVDKVIINQGRRLRAEMKLPGFSKDSFYILEPADMDVRD